MPASLHWTSLPEDLGWFDSPGMGTAGPETQEMWDWGQNWRTHWLCSSHTPGSWPEADTLVEHSQGPARQHSQQLRGAKTTLVPKEEQFCRVVHAPQLFLCGSGQIRLYLRPHPCLALSVSFSFFFLRHERSFVPQPGLNPCSLHWKRGVFTTGLPGKPLFPFVYLAFFPPLKAFPGEMLFHQQIMVHWIPFSGSALLEPNIRQPPHRHQKMPWAEAALENETSLLRSLKRLNSCSFDKESAFISSF